MIFDKRITTVRGSKLRRPPLFWGRLVSCILLAVACSASSQGLKEGLEAQFAELKAVFDRAAQNPVARSAKLSQVDKYFISVLKKNQTFYTLIRTNSKGMVINEVIRGQKPVRGIRDVSKQDWYRALAGQKGEYQSYLLEDNGRYYLFWSSSYFLEGAERFGGVIVAKIDLWDCFHKFSADTDVPFLARLAKKSLYSHKWQEEIAFREERLAVPGAQDISLRYPLSEPSPSDSQVTTIDTPTPGPVSADITPATSPVETSKVAAPQTPAPKKKSSSSLQRWMLVLVAGVIFVLLFIFLLVQLIFKVRGMLRGRRSRR